MRTSSVSLFVSLGFAVAVLACANDSSSANAGITDARKAIDAANAGISRWAAAGQVDSLANIYKTDAWAFPTGEPPMHGREAIRAFWKPVMSGGTTRFTATTDEIDAVGKGALERGKYTIEYTRSPTAPAGSMSSFKDHGNYLTYWVKDGDRWLIKWDAGVSEVPPPAAK